MKLKYRFELAKVADSYMAVAVDDNQVFNGMIKMNETAKEIISILNTKDLTFAEIKSELQKVYPEATSEEIDTELSTAIERLTKAGLIDA